MNKIKCLDNGSVELLEMMGSDATILQAARVSTEALSDPTRDAGLMAYLMRNEHHTPFETVVFKFKIKAPIFVARQWFKHRISSFNEKSARYCEFENFECYVPDNFRKQSTTNRQGSAEFVDAETRGSAMQDLLYAYEACEVAYKSMISHGVAKEQARLVMPVGIYTEWVWTVNLRSLMNFLTLRQHEHAQEEIREYADAINNLIEFKDICLALNAFEDYRDTKAQVQKLWNRVKERSVMDEVLREGEYLYEIGQEMKNDRY